MKIICKELNKPESLITYVADRKGHDLRYAIDPEKIHNELGWLPETKFEDGIKKQFYIPEGFAHGFLVLSDTAEFCYKCTDFYHPGDEGGLLWNDPDINIQWPISDDMTVLLSEKDKKQSLFKDLR